MQQLYFDVKLLLVFTESSDLMIVISYPNLNESVFSDDNLHLVEQFENATQRHRFMEELHLSISMDMLRYLPGGSPVTSVVLARIDENGLQEEPQTEATR